jgi:hypothetical protein
MRLGPGHHVAQALHQRGARARLVRLAELERLLLRRLGGMVIRTEHSRAQGQHGPC